MSEHGEPIGQEWAKGKASWLEVCKLIDQVLGDRPRDAVVALMTVAASCQEDVRRAVLEIAHDHGRHSDGRCPDQCPRF